MAKVAISSEAAVVSLSMRFVAPSVVATEAPPGCFVVREGDIRAATNGYALDAAVAIARHIDEASMANRTDRARLIILLVHDDTSNVP
jgi:hypothetical protein